MSIQQRSSIIDFYIELKEHLRHRNYRFGIIDIPTPSNMRRYLNNLTTRIFTVIADDRTTTITWSIRD